MFTSKLKIIAGCLLVLAVVLRAYFSPSVFMTEFHKVLSEENASDLTAYIDFEKLRTNTKSAVRAHIGQAEQNNPFFQMGMAIGNQVFGSLIDTAITPEVIKMMLTGREEDQERPGSLWAYDFHYIDVNKVRVNFDNNTVMLLDRTGFFSWMIVAIERI
jgi:hypothetical protein